MKKYLVLNCRKKLITENYKLYDNLRPITVICVKTPSQLSIILKSRMAKKTTLNEKISCP